MRKMLVPLTAGTSGEIGSGQECNKCVNVALSGNAGGTGPVRRGCEQVEERIPLQYAMGEVSEMRQFLAMAVLGATLAFGASAALAGEKVDYRPPYEPMQSVSVISGTMNHQMAPSGSAVAGGGNTTATDVFRQLRDENRENKPF